jgi:hypothetical protein
VTSAGSTTGPATVHARAWRVHRRVLPWTPGWGGAGDPFTLSPPVKDSNRDSRLDQLRLWLRTDPRPGRPPAGDSTSMRDAVRVGGVDSIAALPYAIGTVMLAVISLLWTVLEVVVVFVIVTPLAFVARVVLRRPWTVEAVSNVPGYASRYAEHWIWRVHGWRRSNELVETIRTATGSGNPPPPGAVQRFPFRGTALHRFWVDVEPERFTVRTHLWGALPRRAVVDVEELESRGLRVRVKPACRVRVFGVPVRRDVVTLRFLLDPDGLKRELLTGRDAPPAGVAER